MDTIQRWPFDTCGCVIYEAFDDATGGNKRFVSHAEAQAIHQARFLAKPATTLDPAKHPQKPPIQCALHAHLGDTVEQYNVIHTEHIRKNQALNLLQAAKGDPDQATYRWDFLSSTTNPDGTRKLEIKVAISSTLRTQVQTALNEKFGVGLVQVIPL
jgi:hypothetical protein